jgi:hypothetical protein
MMLYVLQRASKLLTVTGDQNLGRETTACIFLLPSLSQTAASILSTLQRTRQMICIDPTSDIPSDIKKLRQANFKQEYKARHQGKRKAAPTDSQGRAKAGPRQAQGRAGGSNERTCAGKEVQVLSATYSMLPLGLGEPSTAGVPPVGR